MREMQAIDTGVTVQIRDIDVECAVRAEPISQLAQQLERVGKMLQNVVENDAVDGYRKLVERLDRSDHLRLDGRSA